MSYVLHIWEKPSDQPWPTTVEEAAKRVEGLKRINPGQNPKFVALAKRLTERYPCITSRQAEEMPESELAWSDGPLDGKTANAVYGVGVRVALLGEVRPFVVDQAKLLGLNVFDPQAGEVFLANGKVLRVPFSSSVPAPEKDYDDVPTGRDLERTVFERLVPFLNKHGYKARKTDRSFKQAFPGGWHSIRVFALDSWPLYSEFMIAVHSRFDAVTDLSVSIDDPDTSPENARGRTTTALGMQKWLGASELLHGGGSTSLQYKITSHAQIGMAMEHLFSNIEARLLPLLERYKTLEGLDALVNPVPVTDSPFFTMYEVADKHIITAYLARNPRLESLCEMFMAKSRDQRKRISLLKYVEYVRGHPLK